MGLTFRSCGRDLPNHPTSLSQLSMLVPEVRVGKLLGPSGRSAEEPGMGKQGPYRLAVLASHPIQYHAPLFRALAATNQIDLTVYFCLDWGANEYFDPGFETRFKWDLPLLTGYYHQFLRNWAWSPTTGRFTGAINPGIIKELCIRQFDGIMIPGYALASYWLAYFGAWISRTPVLFRGETVLRHNRPWWVKAFKRGLLSLLFRGTAAFLPIGSPSEAFYRDFDIGDEKIFFSPYCVDNAFFTKTSVAWRHKRSELRSAFGFDDRPIVLFVGKLVDRKRPLDLLQAYETIHEQAGLVFVGDGPLRLSLERYATDRGLARVCFAGFRNQSELPQFYAMADLFVLPSSTDEVAPLVINEAMCSGLPVIISDAVPSAVDYVRNGENGYTYPCGNVAALRDVLVRLLADSDRLVTLGERSLMIIGQWDVEAAVKGIVRALERVAPRK